MNTITPEIPGGNQNQRSLQKNTGTESEPRRGAEVVLVNFATREQSRPGEFELRRLAELQQGMLQAAHEPQGPTLVQQPSTEQIGEVIQFPGTSKRSGLESAFSLVTTALRPPQHPQELLRKRMARKNAAVPNITA